MALQLRTGLALLLIISPLLLATDLPTHPVNLSFEQPRSGEPREGAPILGWKLPETSLIQGFRAGLTFTHPHSGASCAQITRTSSSTTAALNQEIDGHPWRGQRVRFRAALRASAGGLASLRLYTYRADGPLELVQSTYVRTAEWEMREVIADIAPDATVLTLTLASSHGSAFSFDTASFEAVGAAETLTVDPARPVTAAGLRNLTAFARLLGYVRYFHPSDEAANLDWDKFAVDGIRAIEDAPDPVTLAARLRALFAPVAPTATITPTGSTPPRRRGLSLQRRRPRSRLHWEHHGVDTGHISSLYWSRRVAEHNEPPSNLASYAADLPGGVTVRVPLEVLADAQGTIPSMPDQNSQPPVTYYNYPIADRATRLAAVILAWNVFQHFYPYFDVVDTNWNAALETALREAAVEEDPDKFELVLEKLIAASHDGHGRVFRFPGSSSYRVPILWEWIEGQIIVTHVADAQGQSIAPGDAVITIDGADSVEALENIEQYVPSATPAHKRWRALDNLRTGDEGDAVTLTLEPFADPGARREVTLTRSLRAGALDDPRPPKVTELEPGIWYIDLDRATNADWSAALPSLATASAIIFDLRGYPRLSSTFLRHLSPEFMTSARWHVGVYKQPDRREVEWDTRGRWQLYPSEPYLTAKKIFLTDGRAISYAESLMGIVEHYRLAEIIGSATAGTNGNVNRFRLPGAFSVTWTGMKVLKHDGSQHHGVGILPTIPKTRTRAGVAAGRDELLEAALAAVRP